MSAVFRHTHRVIYASCTVGNHVYYGRYLDILEEARGEFVRALGVPLLQLQEADVIFPVIEVNLRYKGMARYDDLLTIELWLTEAGKVRLNFAYRILCGDRLLVEGSTAHVCTGMNEKPKRLSEDLVAKLRPYLAVG
jgi:acyl-CoA thioester hydrolase